MSAPESLEDIYADELKDLWSANDQMLRALKKIAPKAQDKKLRAMLEKSQEGIERHTEVLKELLTEQGEKAKKDHCKGMEGLVEEAKTHILDEGPEEPELRDVLIIAQYQRMTHYGIAGFGTAAAYAKALGQDEHVRKLDEATAEIYGGDEYGTLLAERTVNIKAAAEAG